MEMSLSRDAGDSLSVSVGLSLFALLVLPFLPFYFILSYFALCPLPLRLETVSFLSGSRHLGWRKRRTQIPGHPQSTPHPSSRLLMR